MNKADEIREIQYLLDQRTEIERHAEKLISECKFGEAMELLENMPDMEKEHLTHSCRGTHQLTIL